MKTAAKKWSYLLQSTYNINLTKKTMSRHNFHSPLAPVLSPVKSEGALNKCILSGLFSKQFLGCLKDELSARKKQTKPKGNEHTLAMEELQQCKRQMEAMRVRIQQLTQLNRALTKRLQLYEPGPFQQENLSEPTVIVCPPKIVRHLEFTNPLGLTISQERQGAQSAKEEELAKLRERVEKLQIHKSIKEQRLNEMLEKEMRFDSELKVLRIKNDELQDEVKCLRETIILQTSEKALKETVNSERQPDIAISYHSNVFDREAPQRMPPNAQASLSHLMPNNDGSLTASFTNNMTIPADFTLSKAELRREGIVPQDAEFNEIDYIIGEELPYLKVSDELLYSRQKHVPPPPMNLNESMVMIDINKL